MLRASLALGLFLLALFVFGPRVRLDLRGGEPRPVPREPDELEALVSDSGGVEGTEPLIAWHGQDTERKRTGWAVVAIHGFSASRQETAPLAEQVARALGANRFEARLTGHGRGGEALAEATAEDWLRDVREAVLVGQRLGDRVVVLASSTGATLAAIAAAHHPPAADAYVFLSPNFGPKDSMAYVVLWPWAEVFVPLLIGKERSWTPQNEEQGRYWTTRYPVRALLPMMATVAAARALPVPGITAPVQVFLHAQDPVVSPEATRASFARWPHPSNEIIDVGAASEGIPSAGDAHVLAGDILSPARTETIGTRIVDWVRRL